VGNIQCFVLKQERSKAWVIYNVVTEIGEKLCGGYIHCCVLKQEGNRTWVIYSVVY